MCRSCWGLMATSQSKQGAELLSTHRIKQLRYLYVCCCCYFQFGPLHAHVFIVSVTGFVYTYIPNTELQCMRDSRQVLFIYYMS